MISTLNQKKVLLILTLFLIILVQPVNAKTDNKNLVNIYFFHSKDCSHCHNEEKFLNKIEKKYNNVKIYRYEVHNIENNQLREKVRDLYQIKTNGVPLTIIGNTPYSGYISEKSDLIFIKTIKYYSMYPYKDKVGELLKIKTPPYEKKENIPNIEDFINTYGNYKLIGPLHTDDFDLTSNAILLGILSQINPIKLISIILVLILLAKIKNHKDKLILISLYLSTSFIINTIIITNNQIYTIIMMVIIILTCILGLLKYIKHKKNKYLYSNIVIIISALANYIEKSFFTSYETIFKELIELHNIFGINKITYYGNYLFIIIAINILTILIYHSIKTTKKSF